MESKNLKGKQVEVVLDRANITANKNPVPFDKANPQEWVGLRLGVSAATTRGLKEEEFADLGNIIVDLIEAIGREDEDAVIEKKKLEVQHICEMFPI